MTIAEQLLTILKNPDQRLMIKYPEYEYNMAGWIFDHAQAALLCDKGAMVNDLTLTQAINSRKP